MEAAFWAFRAYENWAPRWLLRALRSRGTAFALEYVEAEDLATNYVDIGPVSARDEKEGMGLGHVAAWLGLSQAAAQSSLLPSPLPS